MIVFISIGLLVSGIGMVSEEQVELFCSGEYEMSSHVEPVYDYIVDVDQFYYEVGKNMCR